ncbi:hypothetical protein E2C01_037646 [Portunus trituberculatus]|uniref:Uncharacterized protein n=1 Tax=Portunus trituberculatus TaxID=210409 RepID=A0A5B7FEN3_PORTR|nr:hypothetical protein [Portunus trituberculatus]
MPRAAQRGTALDNTTSLSRVYHLRYTPPAANNQHLAHTRRRKTHRDAPVTVRRLRPDAAPRSAAVRWGLVSTRGEGGNVCGTVGRWRWGGEKG